MSEVPAVGAPIPGLSETDAKEAGGGRRRQPERRVGPVSGHIPVLAGPAINALRVRPDGIYVDCTAGEGGHSALILQTLIKGPGRLIALDQDPCSVEHVKKRFALFPQAVVVHRNFAALAEVLYELGIERVDGVLFDVGISSAQLDDENRGFSFEREGPLDMRMNPTRGITARELLEDLDEEALVRILRTYGDVRPAKRIASAIVRRRKSGRMSTTRDLAEAVAEALHFAQGVPEETRTVFQAVRIAVNEELRCLEAGLRQAIEKLGPGGRVVCISFHSGEDRIVKNVLRDASRPRRQLEPDGRVQQTVLPVLRVLTPKPIRPSAEETAVNPRAHSARLRAAERLSEAKGAPQ